MMCLIVDIPIWYHTVLLRGVLYPGRISPPRQKWKDNGCLLAYGNSANDLAREEWIFVASKCKSKGSDDASWFVRSFVRSFVPNRTVQYHTTAYRPKLTQLTPANQPNQPNNKQSRIIMSDDQADTKPEGSSEQITIRVRDQVSYLVTVLTIVRVRVQCNAHPTSHTRPN